MKAIFFVILSMLCLGTRAQNMADLLSKKDTVEILIMSHNGADFNTPDANGTTPLMQVCRWGNDEMISFLLRHKAHVDDPRSARGRTPLMVACAYYTGLSGCKILLDFKADVNATDKNGITPLMLAASNAKLDVVQLLLDKGADPNKKDVNGQTALDYATHATELEYVAKSVKDCKIDKDATVALLKSKTK